MCDRREPSGAKMYLYARFGHSTTDWVGGVMKRQVWCTAVIVYITVLI